MVLKSLPSIVVMLLAVMIVEGAPSDIPAEDILTHIKDKEPVTYDHVVIKGDLDLNQQNISILRINDSRIEGAVNFNGANFLGSVDFRSTRFLRDADFSRSKFEKDVDISGSNFLGDADFSESNFYGDASFMGSKFGERADFGNSNFNKTARFGGSVFSGDADFWRSSFKEYSDFQGANFREDSDFWRTIFEDKADFESCYFKGYADFSGSKFNRDSDFSGSKFQNRADFGRSIFEGDAYFQSSNFTETVIFKDAQFNRKLDFSFISFNKLNIDWYSIKNRDLFTADRDSFVLLIKHFRDVGDHASADDCYYNYRNWRMSTESLLSIKGITDRVFWMSCGYGVKPMHTFFLSFILITIFGLAYKTRDIVQKHGRKASYMDALFFSASIFFTFMPAPTIWNYSERWRFFILLEDTLGWMLMMLFIVTMGNVILR